MEYSNVDLPETEEKEHLEIKKKSRNEIILKICMHNNEQFDG